jgi:hypothetical protein
MALEAGLEQAAFRVADALHHFAQKHQWNQRDYRVLIAVRPEWGRIHIALLSDVFKEGAEKSEYDWYDDIMDFLGEELKDDPSLYRSIGMVIRPLDAYASLARGPLLSPGEVMIPDSLLNPGVEDFLGRYWSTTR